MLALDEPLGALDALTRISMQELINRVWRELGFTAVLVTHDVSEAVHLADRVIVLDEGRIALDLPIPYPHPRLSTAIPASPSSKAYCLPRSSAPTAGIDPSAVCEAA